MHLVVVVALFTVSACTVIQVPLVWKKSEMVELIENGKYSEYSKQSNALLASNLRTAQNTVYSNGGFEYAQKISIGNPGQEFLVWISTTFPLLWVPHERCEEQQCQAMRRFSPNKSTTFKGTITDIGVPDLKGIIRGRLGIDTVRIEGDGDSRLVMPETQFVPVTKLIGFESAQVPFDGVLGLSSVPGYGLGMKYTQPFITKAFKQGYIERQMFTLWFASRGIKNGAPGGVVTYGGVDTVNCDPIIGYEKMISSSYRFKAKYIVMGKHKQEGPIEVKLDTENWMRGPEKVLDQMAKETGAVFNETTFTYEVSCGAQLSDIEISTDSRTYWLDSRNLIINVGNGKCLFAILPSRSDSFDTTWYFGAAFIRQYCAIFDIEHERIFFAYPKNLDPCRPKTDCRKKGNGSGTWLYILLIVSSLLIAFCFVLAIYFIYRIRFLRPYVTEMSAGPLPFKDNLGSLPSGNPGATP